MKCRQAQSCFSEFVDQGLEPRKARALVEHLRSCTECATAWDRFRIGLRALKHLERIEPSPSFEANLWRRIHESKPEGRWANALRALGDGLSWQKLAGAAAVASMILGVLLVGGVIQRGREPGEPSLTVGTSSESVSRPVDGIGDPPVSGLVSTERGIPATSLPAWAEPRYGRLERGFSALESLVDTLEVEPEFVIRRVDYDPAAPPSRAF